MREDNWFKELKAGEIQTDSFWTTGTKTSVGITFFVVSLLLGMGLFSAIGTRTITDDSDSIYGQIIAGQNTFAATAAGLQQAIYSIGNNTGDVDVYGAMMLVTSTIIGTTKIHINFHNSWLYSKTNIDVLRVKPESIIENLNINVSEVGAFTSSGVYLNASDDFKSSKNSTMMKNINIYGGSTQDGNGLLLFASTDPTDPQIGFCTFENFKIQGFKKGIYIKNTATTASGGGWINANTFKNINGRACTYFIYLDNKIAEGANDDYSATNGNLFENIMYQPTSGTDTYFASIEGNHNVFMNCFIWDWTSLGDSTAQWRLNFSANYTYIHSPMYAGASSKDSNIVDSSIYSVYYTGNYLKMRGTNAPGINISNINRYEDADSGVKFFYSCQDGSNAYVYIYGDDGGTNKFGGFRVDSTGSFVFTSDTGENILLSPAQGANTNYVTIDDIMKMDGRTTHPTSPVEGMIYYNTTTNLLMLYTTAWHSIDIT